MKPEVRIESWSISGAHLRGEVYGHPNIIDGVYVTTSTILQRPLGPRKGNRVETRNTIYILGEKGSTPQKEKT